MEVQVLRRVCSTAGAGDGEVCWDGGGRGNEGEQEVNEGVKSWQKHGLRWISNECMKRMDQSERMKWSK